VFYISDPKYGLKWKVLQLVPNKKVWDVPEVEEQEDEEPDEIQLEGRTTVDECIEESILHRIDVEPVIVDLTRNRIQSSNNLDDFIDDHEIQDDQETSSESLSLDDCYSD